MSETYTCEECGRFGDKYHPVYGIQMGAEYKGRILCPTCRVTQRRADGDFAK